MEYFIADPAGNITAFVFGDVNEETAEKLLSDKELSIEQVAFLGSPKLGGHIKCEMAGGEFCGNACRAAGYYYSIKKEQGTVKDVLVEMSGAEGKPVKVKVDPVKETAFAQMPLPFSMETIDYDGIPLPAVKFDGITHIIAPGDLSDKLDLSRGKLHDLCRGLQTSALGVMFLSGDLRLRPLVWVDQVASLVWESSCGSGSTACAWWLSREIRDGRFDYTFTQPGGELTVILTRSGHDCELQMGGPVRLIEDPFLREI